MNFDFLILTALPYEGAHLARSLRLKKFGGFPFPSWSGPCGTKNILMICSGMGFKHTGRAARTVLSRIKPRLIICTGLGGGLHKDIHRGDLIIDNENSEHSLMETVRSGAEHLQIPLHLGKFLTIKSPILIPSEKERLAEKTGASVVNMENDAAVNLAREKNIPFLGIRAVVDAREDRLLPFHAFLSAFGKVQTLRLMLFLIQHPRSLPLLIKTGMAARQSLKHLGRCFKEIMPRL